MTLLTILTKIKTCNTNSTQTSPVSVEGRLFLTHFMGPSVTLLLKSNSKAKAEMKIISYKYMDTELSSKISEISL